MAERKISWRDPASHGDVTCVRCLQVKDIIEVDRILWCDDCRRRARHRAGRWGWIGGIACGAAMGAYVGLVVRPQLLVGGWLAIIAATIWLGSKVCRELIYGGMRVRNVPAAGAATPEEAPPAG